MALMWLVRSAVIDALVGHYRGAFISGRDGVEILLSDAACVARALG